MFSFKPCETLLLVPRIKHLSSFELGFLNIFSRQNSLRGFSLVLFLLQRYKYGAKKCPKNHVRFDFWDDSTLANQKIGNNRKTFERASVEPTNSDFAFFVFRLFQEQIRMDLWMDTKFTTKRCPQVLRKLQANQEKRVYLEVQGDIN